jgi:hypothetical protein
MSNDDICPKADQRTIRREHVMRSAPNGWETCRNGCGLKRRKEVKPTPPREVNRMGQKGSPLDDIAGQVVKGTFKKLFGKKKDK